MTDPFLESQMAQDLWDDGLGSEPANGEPDSESVLRFYNFGPYREARIWVLKDGTAVTYYDPVGVYLKWTNKERAFQYTKSMGKRAQILNRMLGG